MLAGWQHTDAHSNTDYCLELTKNLYGTKQVACGWFIYLCDGLISKGFKQSAIDPCLFFQSDCILVVYTNDCLIFGPSSEQVEDIIDSLKQTFLLKDEGEVKDFLGICVSCTPHAGIITLMQPGLINSVLQDLGLLHDNPYKDKHPVKPQFIPASSILHPDSEGLP